MISEKYDVKNSASKLGALQTLRDKHAAIVNLTLSICFVFVEWFSGAEEFGEVI